MQLKVDCGEFGWSALFRKKRFLVNLKTKRNASKFAMFMEKENPCSFFHFSFRVTFIFPLWMPWSMKVALNEKQKKPHGYPFSINIANFEAILLVFKLTKNLLFLKSVELMSNFLLIDLLEMLRIFLSNCWLFLFPSANYIRHFQWDIRILFM